MLVAKAERASIVGFTGWDCAKAVGCPSETAMHKIARARAQPAKVPRFDLMSFIAVKVGQAYVAMTWNPR